MRTPHFCGVIICINFTDLYKIIYRSGLSLDEAKEQVLAMSDTAPELAVFKDFFALSSRGIIR